MVIKRVLFSGMMAVIFVGGAAFDVAAQDCGYEACIYADETPIYIYPDENRVRIAPDAPVYVERDRSGRARNYDSDGDGLSDETERYYGTDPYYYDTDWDGVPDGVDWAPLDPYRW